MSRKSVIRGYKVITDGDMTGNLTSAETNVTNLDNVGYLVEWSDGATPVGTITVEVQSGPSGWCALDFGSPIAVSGNSGSIVLNINQIPFENIRLNYVAGSGGATLNVTLSSKVVGA
jgi:hypothetical protein